ncbi:MAG TPA: DUF4340 domain-containing protein [Candidatus Brocadiaceae bacterium]
MEKKDNTWKLKDNEQKEVQGKEVDYFIRILNELKGSYIEQYKATNLTQFSLDKPQLVITIGLESGEMALYIGKKKDANNYYVKNKDSEYIYVVGAEIISKLMRNEEGFTTIMAETVPAMPGGQTPIPQEKTPAGTGPRMQPHGGFH